MRYEALVDLAAMGGDQASAAVRAAANDPSPLVAAKARELVVDPTAVDPPP